MVALATVIAAGVLLPKVLPAAIVGRRLPAPAERFVSLLPAALLGGLVAVELLATTGPERLGAMGATLPTVAGVVAAIAVAALTRRALLAMAVGWAVLVASLLVR